MHILISELSIQYSWDEKLPGVYMLLFMETRNQTYETGVESYFQNFWPGGSIKQTAKGLSYPFSWGSLRYEIDISLSTSLADA